MSETTTEQLVRATLFDVLSERDPARRREAIRRSYTEDVVFVDEEGSVRGHDALEAKVQEILDGAVGLVFHADGGFHQLDDMGYQAWTLGPADGPPVVRGADMGFVRDGLLAKVYTVGFR
jgi:hypothetical protein